MKKIDLHLHTISTVSDHPFEFSMDSLHKVYRRRKIGCDCDNKSQYI